MGQVLSIADFKARPQVVFFDRRELSKLLNVYSRRVISGEWRDYAIDHDGRRAVFSVFRNSAEMPVFSVAKEARGARETPRYVVTRGPCQVSRAGTIDEAIVALERQLRSVSPARRA
ncbi:MAG: DUF2794 domain-containing protein [Alphaproteobacteria bacterium]|nr:DUF2794 domain-containing protein [Alphaproteobacteria bacterium]